MGSVLGGGEGVGGVRLIAIVRTNGERTKDLAAKLVSEQVETEVIAVRPFTEAVKRCFDIALEAKADWLLTVDGDILVKPGAVDRMVELAGEMGKGVFHFYGQIRCKLYMDTRQAGIRMYRVQDLPKLRSHIIDAIRVESAMLKSYAAQTGLSIVQVNDFFGLHDYEQWHRDIYRKASVHAVKHARWAKQGIVKAWEKSSDPDLQAAYRGWHGFPLGMEEKPPLPEDFVVEF